MKAEFVKDINGTIWFSFSHDIYVRPTMKLEQEKTLNPAKVKSMNHQIRDKHIALMEKHTGESQDVHLCEDLKGMMD